MRGLPPDHLEEDLESNWNVCPKCGVHTRIDAVARLKLLFTTPNMRLSTAVCTILPTRSTFRFDPTGSGWTV
ncbi:MAG: hypothetical protein U0Q18_01670 [Bryobacteraceae bacterium]